MAFTLSQFKSALGQNVEAGVEATNQFAGKAWDTTKSTAATVGTAVKGAMPASNKKVDNIATKFNSRLNNVEMEQRVQEVYINMIAQAKGVILPSKEEVMEALLEEDRAEAQIKQAEETAKKVEAIADVVANPELTKMLGMLAQKFFGANPFGEEEEEEENYILEVKETVLDESEVPNEVKAKAEAKKQEEGVTKPLNVKKTGRKKLGRQAPLAD
jgi:hypothetical protein